MKDMSRRMVCFSRRCDEKMAAVHANHSRAVSTPEDQGGIVAHSDLRRWHLGTGRRPRHHPPRHQHQQVPPAVRFRQKQKSLFRYGPGFEERDGVEREEDVRVEAGERSDGSGPRQQDTSGLGGTVVSRPRRDENLRAVRTWSSTNCRK